MNPSKVSSIEYQKARIQYRKWKKMLLFVLYLLMIIYLQVQFPFLIHSTICRPAYE